MKAMYPVPWSTVLALLLVGLVVLAGCAAPPPPVAPQPPAGEEGPSPEELAALQAQVAELQAQLEAAQQENQNLSQQTRLLLALAGPPPASLDALFPPQAEAPQFLFAMYGLAGTLEGLIVDLQEQDMEGAQANYERFRQRYTDTAQMVPEWTRNFRMEPVDALGEALASGDPGQVFQAIGQVGQVCSTCHMFNQVKTMHKYHWGDFREVSLVDPVSGEEVVWVDYMFRMAGAYAGIGNDLGQGQIENARMQYEAFAARFQGLAEGCENCHDSPRYYYVDEESQARVAQLGELLAADTPDPQAVGQMLNAIGSETCFKCHLTHFPAARAWQRWDFLEARFGQ